MSEEEGGGGSKNTCKTQQTEIEIVSAFACMESYRDSFIQRAEGRRGNCGGEEEREREAG